MAATIGRLGLAFVVLIILGTSLACKAATLSSKNENGSSLNTEYDKNGLFGRIADVDSSEFLMESEVSRRILQSSSSGGVTTQASTSPGTYCNAQKIGSCVSGNNCATYNSCRVVSD